MRITQISYVVSALVVFLLSIGLALAHGVGPSFEQQTENGSVDIGYTTEDIDTDTSVVFDFALLTEADGAAVEFTDVWVRFVTNDSTVFATGVHNARIGGALLTYRFPAAGEYTLIARFQNNGTSVTEVEFPISVDPGKGSIDSSLIIAAITLALGFVLGILFGAYKRRFTFHS